MQPAVWLLLLLATACICETWEIVDPCKWTEEEIREAKLSLETIVVGRGKSYPLGDLAYAGRDYKDDAVCKCKHGVRRDDDGRRWLKTFEWCSDDRWKVLAEIAIELQKMRE